MSSLHNFPVILVSAGTNLAAKTIIADIIDNEPSETAFENQQSCCKVWRITNKYYTADVNLHPIIDGNSTECDIDSVQAHIIYLSEEECEESVAEYRSSVTSSLSGNATRLVLAACSEPSDKLSAWARRRRYEVVPLLEVPLPCDPEEPFPEMYGLQRARAALHAHRWDTLSSDPYDESSDGEQYPSDDEEGAVERMEDFAAMLGVVSSGERDRLSSLSRDERLRRAEDLVAAFCQAMGQNLEHW